MGGPRKGRIAANPLLVTSLLKMQKLKFYTETLINNKFFFCIVCLAVLVSEGRCCQPSSGRSGWDPALTLFSWCFLALRPPSAFSQELCFLRWASTSKTRLTFSLGAVGTEKANQGPGRGASANPGRAGAGPRGRCQAGPGLRSRKPAAGGGAQAAPAAASRRQWEKAGLQN